MASATPTREVERRWTQRGPEAATGAPLMVLLLAYVLLAATFFVVRGDGRWAEQDSAALASAIRAVDESGSLVPTNGPVYPNGYAFTALSVWVLALGGVPLTALLQVIYPISSALLLLPHLVLYRQVTGSQAGALLATLLLYLQSDFLFVTLRGSHERVLRALVALAFWLLIRSFRLQDRTATFAVHVLLFYLVAYGVVATNFLFGLSFFVAVVSAMLGAWVLDRIRPELAPLAGGVARRFGWLCLSVAVLGFVSIFYLYTPARFSISALSELGRKLVVLLLTTEARTEAFDPYAAISTGWISFEVYAVLSVGTYGLLLGAAGVWLWWTWRWLGGRERPTDVGRWLLWLLFATFAAQGALSIAADRASTVGGNLQVRSLPTLATLAAPLCAMALLRLGRGRGVGGLIAALAAVGAALAILKASNEPILSRRWTAHDQAELAAMTWLDQHHWYESIWVGPDERLRSAELLRRDSSGGNRWDIYAPDLGTSVFLISETMRRQALQMDVHLPTTEGHNQFYDNGSAAAFRPVARTRFSR